jgi:16S rRNA (guanine527-N7)-methyltransferase
MPDLTKEQTEKIQSYCDLLIKWNAKINLIGRASEAEIMERHVLDCLKLSEFIPDRTVSIADLGTGAGLPGLILAIAGFTKITLIEADQKKCVFLREARRVLNIDCQILCSRIEDIIDVKYDLIVSRALASLDTLLKLSLPLLNDTASCLFLKGNSYAEEIIVAERSCSFDYTVHGSKSGSDGVILEIHNIRKLG